MAGTPITCSTLENAKRNPSLIKGLIRIDGNNIVHDASQVTSFYKKENRFFYVTTVEELHAVKEKLQTKPFVFVMPANLNIVTHLKVVTVTTNYREVYVVQVNPAHSMISSVLDAKFEQAYKSIMKGETFVIELNFNHAVAKLHRDLLNKSNLSGPQAVKGVIFITNKQDADIIDCGGIWNYLCCFCRCLIHPFYLCYLDVKCKRYIYDFKNTPAALRTCLNGNVVDIVNRGKNTSDCVDNRTCNIPVQQDQTNAVQNASEQENDLILPVVRASTV